MDEREMLVLAAKAAGIDAIYPFGPGEIYVRWTGLWAMRDTSDEHGALKAWSPLTDDGDALRLAVKLKITLYLREDEPVIEAEWRDSTTGYANVCEGIGSLRNGPTEAAVRRAIVRAAAEIGKALP